MIWEEFETLSFQQLVYLIYLYYKEEGDYTYNIIKEIYGEVCPSLLTSVRKSLIRLENGGFVQSSVKEKNNRIYRIFILTEKGKKFVKEFFEMVSKWGRKNE